MSVREVYFGKHPLALRPEDFPVFVHGKEGNGASLFSVILAASVCRSGFPLLFWSAYPMAKEEFRKEILDAYFVQHADKIEDKEQQTIIIQNDDPNELIKASVKIMPERILFVKNFETVPREIQADLLKRKNLIISGDLEHTPARGALTAFPTRIFFSPFPGIALPELKKYEGFMLAADKSGFVKTMEK